MKKKICIKCKKELSLRNFIIRDKIKEIYDNTCKKCDRYYNKVYYKKNRAAIIERTKERSKRLKLQNVKYVLEYLLEHPCIDCGETNPLKLEFDHRDRAEKDDSIAHMLSKTRSLVQIQNEISKCDVRCSNCHKVKTAEEANWLMAKLYKEYLNKT